MSWLETVAAYKKSSGKTLKQLGKEIAVLLGAEAPLNPTSVFEYIEGETVTLELTEAFAKLMGTALPPFVSETDIEIDEWTDLGRRLKAHTPDKFTRELFALRALVDALEKHARRH
jgi:hypothetical protein